VAANTLPIFVKTPAHPQARVSTANTARDGSGTLATIHTAGADGSFFAGVRAMAHETTVADVVRIFVQKAGAGNNELLKEMMIPAVTPSASVEAASQEWYPSGGLTLGAGDVVKAATDQGKTYTVSLENGGDY
jgi:hypothetical protein